MVKMYTRLSKLKNELEAMDDYIYIHKATVANSTSQPRRHVS